MARSRAASHNDPSIFKEPIWMTLPLLLLVVVLAALFRILRWHRTSLTLYLCALAAFLLVGSGVPANMMLRALQNGQETNVTGWGTHNAIVLLGAGSQLADRGPESTLFSYGRLVKALEVYRACKAQATDCRIISSGGDTHHDYGVSEAELYAAQLERLGVPIADLINESRSMNTWQNAQFTAAIVAEQKFDRVVLVTSGFHLPRSVLYFSHFGVPAQPVRADYALAAVSVVPTAYNVALADIALHEYIGVLRYHVYNLLGWNVRATRPGAV
jgi:uncharacterized SAM-binding protein YcdF (DUF218 family)